MRAKDFSIDDNGDRFFFRSVDGRWEVYGAGGKHICYCESKDAARMIANALEISVYINLKTARQLYEDG